MPQDTLDIQTAPVSTRTSAVALQAQSSTSCGDPPPEDAWSPPINVLRYPDRIEIIVELAGLNREDVHLSIKDRCLRIQGVRTCLEATYGDSAECRVLMMEIGNGPFDRVLSLPKALGNLSEQVSARQESGLLWITIPVST